MHNRKKGEKEAVEERGRREEEKEGRRRIPGVMAERYWVRSCVCN